ncbi:MAG: hypothetical protein HOB88_17840 [Bacteroidetes bacterium]|nr:hypothetical protein [Bacteroidota bacterium]MBT4730306.1 hypothetical protein [Bacteroidota bacterium]
MKLHIKIAPLVLILVFVISFTNCNKHISKAFIEPPLNGINIEFISFKADAASENNIDLGYGNSIEIPANAFVNQNNEPISGEVDIDFREFQEAADILISGIPMTYDSGGVKYDFQTAGMFEINASQSGEQIYIAEGKKLKVNLASEVDGDYNFYKLDTNRRNWAYMGAANPSINERKAELEKDIPKMPDLPKEPRKFSKKDPIIDFDIDYKDFPELKAFSTVLWAYSDQNKNPRIKSINWVFKTKWASINLKEYDSQNALYLLNLKNGELETEFLVSPVLSSSDHEKALIIFNKQMSNYNIGLAERKLKEERIENERSFIRSYEIMDFGIFNWDIFYKRKDIIAFNARIKYDQDYDLEANDILVYLITANNKAIIKYNSNNLSSFRFCPSDENKLVSILPGNKIAVFTNRDFKLLVENELSARKVDDYEFKMKIINKEVSSTADFKKLIATI